MPEELKEQLTKKPILKRRVIKKPISEPVLPEVEEFPEAPPVKKYDNRHTPLQRETARLRMVEFHKKIKEGKEVKTPWTKHAAYTFLKRGDIPKDKRNLMKFVDQERSKWAEDLGGVKNLSYTEVSLLDEATRLLLWCTLINDYLIREKENSILFKDKETGEFKMHSALSKNYLSFTRSYVSILKDLAKMAANPKRKGKGGKNIDAASKIQEMYRSENS